MNNINNLNKIRIPPGFVDYRKGGEKTRVKK